MAQFLVAQWDYVAEGNYELSFKEGDKIKLLEKHNDDWWEGELNDEIGFFPANRTTPFKPTTTATPTIDTPRTNLAQNTNPYLNSKPSFPERWSHSYDQSGKVFFLNEKTSESQWEQPKEKQNRGYVAEVVYSISKLNLEALHPGWIRLQNHIQMKVITDETVLSWKDYYAVLINRFIIIYKEGLNKMGRRPSSFKHVPAYCTIDLKPASLVPATKSDTRKKYAVIIDLADNYKILLNLPNEILHTEWLDAIMREMINASDDNESQVSDLVDLLESLNLQSKLPNSTQPPAENPDDADSKSTLSRWFSRSSKNNGINKQLATTPTLDTIGGQIKLEQGGSVPLIVLLCVNEVEKRGLDTIGIYRISGQTTSVQKLKTQFNTKPEEVNLEQEPDINVITSLLKLYFRELKNPLLTFEYYDRFIEAARLQDYDERMFRLKSIVQVLPIPNYKVLEFLARHLERVKNQSHINKMETTNLALIFSMSLLRAKEDDIPASILHNDLSSKVIEIIVSNVDWFFDIDTDDETNSV